MPIARIDATLCATATCPPGKKKIDIYDDIHPGLILTVQSTGLRTFSLRYRDEHGRQRQYKLGNYPDISWDKAKREATKARSRVVMGENPAEVRSVTRRIPPFSELAERYQKHVESYKRSHDIDERYLRNHIVPRFGKLRLDEISQTDTTEWLRSKVNAGYAQATVNRWQVIINLMYKLGKTWGIHGTDRNPLEGVKLPACDNHIEHFLSGEETQRLLDACGKSCNKQLRFIVSLLVLCGCRKRELLDATWDQFDLPRKTWRIPMTKSGKARHVPLSEAAIEVLQQVPRFEGVPYVVPNLDTMLPFVDIFYAWNNARIAAGLPHIRLHDLRHSAASNLANSGHSLYVIAKVLGHSQTRTTERYAHLSNQTLLSAVNTAAASMGIDWGVKESVES